MHPETLQNKRHMKCQPFITWVTLKLQVAIIIHFKHLQNHKPKKCSYISCINPFFVEQECSSSPSNNSWCFFWSKKHILRPFGVSGHDHSAVDAVLAVLQPILVGQEDVNVLILPRNRWTKTCCGCCSPFLLNNMRGICMIQRIKLKRNIFWKVNHQFIDQQTHWGTPK